MRITMVLFLFLLVGNCVTPPHQFKGPNGRPAYSMVCSGEDRSQNNCYTQAGKICQNGYTIIDQSTSTVAVPSNGTMIASPQKNMVIECK